VNTIAYNEVGYFFIGKSPADSVTFIWILLEKTHDFVMRTEIVGDLK